jgi:protein JSN1
VILNSIPLATNPNGALLLTWLLDTSGFHNRYSLLAPRFTPHLSHLCTHKLASVTVLRIVNQKSEPEASRQIVQALFFSPNDHVLSDVLGDQINGVAVVHKILQSSFLDPLQRPSFLEATKRVLIDLKVTTAQAYRRLIEEVGLPIPSFASAPTNYGAPPVTGNGATKKPSLTGMNMQHGGYGAATAPQVVTPPQQPFPVDPSDPTLQSVMASLHILELQQQASRLAPNRYGPLPTSSAYGAAPIPHQTTVSSATFSPSSDPFLPLPLRGEYGDVSPVGQQRMPYGQRPSTSNIHANGSLDSYDPPQIYGTQANGSPGGSLLPPASNGMISGSMGQLPSSPYGVAQPMHPHVSPGILCNNNIATVSDISE